MQEFNENAQVPAHILSLISGKFKPVSLGQVARREPAQSGVSPLNTRVLKPGQSRTMRAIEEAEELECFDDTGSYTPE